MSKCFYRIFIRLLLFFHTFPVLWEFTLPMFWKLHGFLIHWNGMFCFPILFSFYWYPLCPCIGDNTTDVKTNKKILLRFRHFIIHFINSKSMREQNLGIVCVFPYFFCDTGIQSSHRLGSIPLEYFCFPIIFPYFNFSISSKLQFNFFMLWKLYGFLLHAKYVTNP